MFGLGPTELIVILVLGVLLLGPQRIPEVASSLGKAIRSFRRATRELRDQIDIEDEVRRPLEDLRAALRDEPAPPPPAPRLAHPPNEPIHSILPEPEDHEHETAAPPLLPAPPVPQAPAAMPAVHPQVHKLGQPATVTPSNAPAPAAGSATPAPTTSAPVTATPAAGEGHK
jgi:TatA/E family protein of Tat protein translocase